MTGRVVPSHPLRSGRAPLNLTLRRASPATLPGAVAALRQSDAMKNISSGAGRTRMYEAPMGEALHTVP
jgi:hypothetical protein